MHWIPLNVDEVARWRNVVGKATNRCRISCHVIFLPFANKTYKVVSFELSMQHLAEEIKIRNKGTLQNDWDVGCVE